MERIDVHAHCVPPSYREYCVQNDFAGRGHPDGMPAIPAWDATAHIALMKQLNIKRSILSISSPGTHLTPGDDEEARILTRRINTDLAEICAAHPHRFSFFASLPLPDVDGSLAEIDYVFDRLGATGVQILTNSHGVYPGDPRFACVFDKLSERKAIVFLHPTTCWVQRPDGVMAVDPQPGVPRPMLEFMFDSTRAIMSVLFSGTMRRCPGITVLVCHCGATFPPILNRIAEFSGPLLGKENALSSDEVKETMQTRFYFDLAGVPFPDQMHGLLRLVDSTRLLYGSDFPYTPAPLATILADRVDAGIKRHIECDLEQVLVKNAEELLRHHQI